MRLSIKGELSALQLSVDYRKALISYLKNALSETDKSIFEKFYKESEGVLKEFATAFLFNTNGYEKGVFQLKSNDVRLIITTSDIEIGIKLYNALLSQLHKDYPIFQNTFKATAIHIEKDPLIASERIEVKLLSPLLVRNPIDHKLYTAFDQGSFQEHFVQNIKEQLVRLGKWSENEELNIDIIPIQPKKVVVKHYGQYMDGQIGSFELRGNSSVLKYLYDSGIGSRRSAGFGVFNIIGG